MKCVRRIGYICSMVMMALNFSPALAADEARQAYDKMVEEATREADAYLQEKQERKQAAQKESKEGVDAELQEKVAAERKSILTEMDAVRQRGLGTNFTQGMKQNQLQALQERLDRLTSDPETYFERQ